MGEQNFIDSNADLVGAKAAFEKSGVARVMPFLQKAIAEQVLHAFLNDTDWKVALRIGEEDRLLTADEWRVLDPQAKQEMLRQVAAQARVGFSYIFEYYQLLAAYMENWRPQSTLHQLAGFIRSDEFVEAGRRITGDDSIIEADCQAMRYQPGHYLSMHTDDQVSRRRAAYVLGFTPQWRPDWGGLLQFFDDSGDVRFGFAPTFNSLSIFSVPQNHAVSFVTPSAGAPRLTVTGWFLAA